MTAMRVLVVAFGVSGLMAACSSDADDATPSTPACTEQAQLANRACVPGTAKANVPLTIAVDLTTGCLPCFTKMKPCAVSMQGTAITIGMRTETCKPAGDQACPAICAFPSTTCELPALPAGIYSVTLEGETEPNAPRRLFVADDAVATSCALAVPSPSNLPLDIGGLSTRCTTDADCMAAAASVCAPCTCPSVAIAKTEEDAYDAISREARSQCGPAMEILGCGACEDRKPACNASGACELR